MLRSAKIRARRNTSACVTKRAAKTDDPAFITTGCFNTFRRVRLVPTNLWLSLIFCSLWMSDSTRGLERDHAVRRCRRLETRKPERMIAKAINGGYDLLEANCNRSD